ncbi:MAG: T9SS type A sorting domain-containing protein [Flavobacteriales bacterium]|nr:T9SS type A sorting domain-containing protein [Flavobacteriales bacterium]
MKTICTFIFSLAIALGMAQWPQYSIGTTLELGGVHVFSNGDVLIAGEMGLMKRSSDCGSTWTDVDITYLNDIGKFYFIDQNTGYVLGDDAAFGKTTDGGLTWTFSNTPASDDLEGLYFLNADMGWMVGKEGNIIHTSDGGATWMTQSSGSPARLHGVHFIDEMHGIVCGRDNTLLTTDNGGQTWTPLILATSGDMKDIAFAQGSAYIAAEGGLYRLNSTWDNVEFIAIDPNSEFEDVYFHNESIGWACGGPGKVMATNNGGETWIDIGIEGSPFELSAIHGQSFNQAFTVGEFGQINGVCTAVGLEGADFSETPWSVHYASDGTLHILFPDQGPRQPRFQIMDITGAMIAEESLTPLSSQNMYSIPAPDVAGVYLISMIEAGAIQTKRIVIHE